MSSTSDRDLDRRRRDIYAVSLGLLIFNLAGGTVPESAPILFGSVHIARPWILEIAAWIGWSYFLWRFWLAGKPLWGTFLDDVDIEIELSRSYGKFMRDHFQSVVRMSRKELRDESGWIAKLNQNDLAALDRRFTEYHDRSFRFKLTERSYAREFQREIIRFPDGRLLGNQGKIPDGMFEQLMRENPWHGFHRARALAAGFFGAAWKRHAFSDRVLPVIVAIASLIVFIARQAWLAHLS